MSDLDRVLGRSPINEVTTASAIPVVATVPASRFAKRKDLVSKDEQKRRRSRLVSGVLGMTEEVQSTSDEESLFPSDAEELDGSQSSNPGVHVKKPKFKQDDPDSPKDEEEQLLSPRAALVAPDVTPDSMTEIDPSDVPGPKATSFKASDAAPAPAPAPTPGPAAPGSDQFMSTMDTLLGRDRQAKPTTPTPPPPPTMESAAISPEAAAAMFSGVSGDTLLAQGQAMPEPVVGDGKKICEAFRRFNG